MSTDLNVKLKRVIKSFSFAIEGIYQAVKQERNLKIHLGVAVFVILLGLWLSLSVTEWIFVFFAIAGVLSFELVNTAVERAVNLVTEQYHPLAKQAKDIAAGAVLIYAILSVIIGLIIFIPKLVKLI